MTSSTIRSIRHSFERMGLRFAIVLGLQVIFVIRIEAQSVTTDGQQPSAAAPTVGDWKRRALAAFPEAGISGSPLSKRIGEDVALRRNVAKEIFNDPRWPFTITSSCAAGLGILPITASGTDSARSEEEFIRDLGAGDAFGEAVMPAGVVKDSTPDRVRTALSAALASRGGFRSVSDKLAFVRQADANGLQKRFPALRQFTIRPSARVPIRAVVTKFGPPDYIKIEKSLNWYCYGALYFGVTRGNVFLIRISCGTPHDPASQPALAEAARKEASSIYTDKLTCGFELAGESWSDDQPSSSRGKMESMNSAFALAKSNFILTDHEIGEIRDKGVLEIGSIKLGADVNWIRGRDGIAIARASEDDFQRLGARAKDLDLTTREGWDELAKLVGVAESTVKEISFFDADGSMTVHITLCREFVFFDGVKL